MTNVDNYGHYKGSVFRLEMEKCKQFFQMFGFGTSKISPVANTKEKRNAKTRQNQALWSSGFRLAWYPSPVVRG
jgi:hypothetical protein